MHSTGGMRWTLSLVLLTACALDEATVETTTSELGCTNLICGGNSPIECALSICELDGSRNEYSRKGFKITKAWHEITGEDLPVYTAVGAEISYVTAGGVKKHGDQALNTHFEVENKDGARFELKIDDIAHPTFYDGTTSTTFIAYHVLYRYLPAPPMTPPPFDEMCPFGAYVDNGLTGAWALFWNGDRIDDSGKIIASNERVGSWFNISCAGEVAPKAARMKASGATAPKTSTSERQSALYFFSGDYCGNGTHQTILGQPIMWKDLWGPIDFAAPLGTNEAIWDGRGAVCLDTPRYVPRDSVVCPDRVLNRCKTLYDNWSDHGFIYSANPLMKL
jgi:ADYC domain-containing protein